MLLTIYSIKYPSDQEGFCAHNPPPPSVQMLHKCHHLVHTQKSDRVKNTASVEIPITITYIFWNSRYDDKLNKT